MKDVTTATYEVWAIDDESFGVMAKIPHLAFSINKIVKKYPEETEFTLGDEPMFKVGRKDYDRVCAILAHG